MLIFGHSGITLGVAVLLNEALFRSHALSTRENRERLQVSPESVPARNCTTESKTSCFTSLANRIDIRILLIGSLLPDIIDKLVGNFFFRDTFSNGRIFCHTLPFLILISILGFYLYRSREKTWLLALSFGTFTHLIFDQMWLQPQTLFWPLYGFAFERVDLTHWVENILYALHTDPYIYVSEIIGAAILIWFASELVRQRKVYAFIGNGSV